jgi:IclR family acetate operon transcriptional repressor
VDKSATGSVNFFSALPVPVAAVLDRVGLAWALDAHLPVEPSNRLGSGIPRTKALQRAVSVLHAVAAEPGASASSLSRTAELPRSTVTRTLRTLADAGLVEEVTGGWMLGYEVVRLARAADPFRAVIRAAGRPLDQLRDATGESALLAVPVGRTEMEIVLQLNTPHVVGVTDWVGVHPPLHASSAGSCS